MMNTNEIKVQQRYQDLIREARKTMFIALFEDRAIREPEVEVVCVMNGDYSFNEYKKTVKEYIKDLTEEDIFLSFNAKEYVIIKCTLDNEPEYSLTLSYANDEDFRYYGTMCDGELCLDSKLDRAGWRDLSDSNDRIYDYFLVDGEVLQYKKPVNTGDYSNQEPVIMNIGEVVL